MTLITVQLDKVSTLRVWRDSV